MLPEPEPVVDRCLAIVDASHHAVPAILQLIQLPLKLGRVQQALRVHHLLTLVQNGVEHLLSTAHVPLEILSGGRTVSISMSCDDAAVLKTLKHLNHC